MFEHNHNLGSWTEESSPKSIIPETENKDLQANHADSARSNELEIQGIKDKKNTTFDLEIFAIMYV